MSDTIYDVSTAGDLDPVFANVSALRAVGERVARRYQTEPGTLEYAPDDGYDVRAILSGGVSSSTLAAMRLRMKAEAEKDDEVVSATVTVSESGETLKVSVRLETDEGTATLLLAIDQVTVDVLDVLES